jgi:GT2 family glycosyltransferase
VPRWRVPVSSASVVVPVKNGARSLPGLLDALAEQTFPGLEVLVVDNGSTDGTQDVAAAHAAVTRVLHEPAPGSYAARNAGVAQATGDAVLFTDADCRPVPGWAAALVAALDDPEPALAAGPVVLRSDARSPWRRAWGAYDRAVYLDQQRWVELHGQAATANLAVRRELLLARGGFDATLRSGGDHEFTGAATRDGHRIGWAPEAVVHHPARDSLGEAWRLWTRLGRGFEDLASQGGWSGPLLRRDPVLREPTAAVKQRAEERGVELSTPVLYALHAVVRAAVLTGRLRQRRALRR